MFKDKILDSIEDIIKNYRVFLVGGYLRNFFIKNEISTDRDLVCVEEKENTAYNLAQDISKKLQGTFIELDSENKIYRVVLKDKINFFDVSKALDNNILKDAKRRDFTINSIFYDLNKKEIFDPQKGIDDIKNRILRTEDNNNLIDDALRFLRLYRFQSQTGFEIEGSLENFVKSNFHLIENIAKERINHEIIEIFKGKYLNQTLLKMFDDGTLEQIFPFVKEIKKIPSNTHHHLDLIHHSIETVNNIRLNNPLLKIAAFYHDIGKPSTWTIDETTGRHRFIGHDIKGAEIAKKELSNLKFSNKQIEYISKMIKYHIYPATLADLEEPKKAFARFVRKLADDAPDIIELSRADRLSAQGSAITKEMTEKAINHLENLLNYYNEVKTMVQDPKPLLNGNEVAQILNLKPSKQIGEILNEIKEAQLAGEIRTKDEAEKLIKRLYK